MVTPVIAASPTGGFGDGCCCSARQLETGSVGVIEVEFGQVVSTHPEPITTCLSRGYIATGDLGIVFVAVSGARRTQLNRNGCVISIDVGLRIGCLEGTRLKADYVPSRCGLCRQTRHDCGASTGLVEPHPLSPTLVAQCTQIRHTSQLHLRCPEQVHFRDVHVGLVVGGTLGGRENHLVEFVSRRVDKAHHADRTAGICEVGIPRTERHPVSVRPSGIGVRPINLPSLGIPLPYIIIGTTHQQHGIHDGGGRKGHDKSTARPRCVQVLGLCAAINDLRDFLASRRASPR